MKTTSKKNEDDLRKNEDDLKTNKKTLIGCDIIVN